MENFRKVLIVGGVAGGATAAARLRRSDENAHIIMFERGEYISFANCGLPYYIGGEIKEKSSLTLQTPESFNARYNVDVRVFSEVIAIHTDKKTVTVLNHKTGERYDESYSHIILSPGAEPLKPNIDGINSPRVFTLRTIPDTFAITDFVDKHGPRRVAIAGGGFIGVETAENLRHKGLDVTIIEMADQVIAPIDYDMASDVHRHIESKGVHLALGNALRSITDTGSSLKLALNSGELEVDFLVMAIGVRPESRLAREAGLTVSDRGAIIVDEYMRTSNPDIYAVGDAIQITEYVTGRPGFIPLAGPANKQARIAADNICGASKVYKGTQGTSILKVFDLTVASTGINEKTAKAANIAYDKVFTYSANHASYYPGAVNMSIKTIFEKSSGKILGAQIVGYEGSDKRIDIFATAIRAGMTASDLAELELAYAPPYGSAKDPVNMAGFVIENILDGRVKQVHWHDIQNLPRDGSVTLVDTRTPIEYENGHIDGFINMPLDSLRSRIGELDKSKPVYVMCQIGLRGYVASRILTQKGFTAYNVSGGYRLYNSIYGAHQDVPHIEGFNSETQMIDPISREESDGADRGQAEQVVHLDACGLQCPGPIMKLSQTLSQASPGHIIEIKTTDPAFACDLEGFCKRTGNIYIGTTSEKGVSTASIRKGGFVPSQKTQPLDQNGNGKNIIVFSGDLDKAIASFIIANAAAAMGREVTMFFTFWGLTILRKPKKVPVKKDIISRMFGFMMPRGSKKLSLSRMNMGGMGAKMIRSVMKNKNVSSLEDLIMFAQANGVKLQACSMSMDVMGIKKEELIDGVTLAGAAAMLAHGEESDMSLFI